MARGRPRTGSAARAAAGNAIATGAEPAPNGNGPAKAYRHKGEKRRNIPPAAIAAEGRVPAAPKLQYSYSPRLDPVLRFDLSGAPDKLPELLEKAKREPLTYAEARILAEALRRQDPWLEWAGKREANGFAVDPVALHIHERVSTQAILKVAARKDVTRDLFADPQLDYHEAVQFYRHEMDWSNRLILGDSLQVMASLAQREDLAGKVQMIYVDPPYGIRFGSNFQTEVGNRESKENEKGLTREIEMVRAFRDTWHLGVHSYLAYLRDRFVLARELLTDSGSIFVQIGDENVHLVGGVLDDVFGRGNRVSQITIQKTTSSTGELISNICDYVLWYAKDIDQVRYRSLYQLKARGGGGSQHYSGIELADGERCSVGRFNGDSIPRGRFYTADQLQSASMGREKGLGAASWFPVVVAGKEYLPSTKARWKTNEDGMARIVKADRALPQETALRYLRYMDDFPAYAIHNIWADVGGATNKGYVVETSPKVIERCMLMTTEPGDLVLDPTCGGGTTAIVAEEWGRRWITIDTSRIALAITRQRLLTAKFEYFDLKDEAKGVGGGFRCKTVPHIGLRSIAHNSNLDPIFAKHEPILEKALSACNAALAKVPPDIKTKLAAKLIAKQKAEGRRAVTEANRRRWLLPPDNREKDAKLTVDAKFRGWYHWEVPFDADPDWPKPLQDAVTAYRTAWRAKMDDVNACIEANAEQEELVDQREVRRGVVRVSGPFTVEAVQPQELSLDDGASPIGGVPEPAEEIFDLGKGEAAVLPPAGTGENPETDAKNADSYIENMTRLLRIDGVRFPDNKEMKFSRLDPMGARSATIHAEGRWMPPGETDADPEGRATVCVAFGPQYGPVTAAQVEILIRAASRRGYDDLLIAGFAFDGPAQTVIEESDHPHVRIHMAHIRPDVNPAMDGLLKETPGSQLFSVFGRPRTRLQGPAKDGTYTVSMEGVDIYDPVTNAIDANRADKVAAWFVDTDYDGRTFCITQAFFPDKSAWEKLAKALKGAVDETAFAALAGTVSPPFPAGKHKAVAVKVIDPRGNEVMRMHRLS
jgi:adenine-specific DNA-methyltransferase